MVVGAGRALDPVKVVAVFSYWVGVGYYNKLTSEEGKRELARAVEEQWHNIVSTLERCADVGGYQTWLAEAVETSKDKRFCNSYGWASNLGDR